MFWSLFRNHSGFCWVNITFPIWFLTFSTGTKIWNLQLCAVTYIVSIISVYMHYHHPMQGWSNSIWNWNSVIVAILIYISLDSTNTFLGKWLIYLSLKLPDFYQRSHFSKIWRLSPPAGLHTTHGVSGLIQSGKLPVLLSSPILDC